MSMDKLKKKTILLVLGLYISEIIRNVFFYVLACYGPPLPGRVMKILPPTPSKFYLHVYIRHW